jgi:spermidine/putrescine transport system ATP-binding protein
VTLNRPSDLVLEDVSKSFGKVAAVDGVSFAVRPGEFYSLLGPSGCGKTTTLRLIAGFEAADSGRITLEGDDITLVAPDRRRINTVFQHYALFPHMTVEANVAYGLEQKKIPKTEIADRLGEALRMVRLDELKARYPRELSGGQQQRVALARALINRPAVLLLDEPLAALDLKLRKAMQQELKKLQEHVGITFVYVTHDQEEALTLSDRIAVMNDGNLLQEGTPTEIYERPRTRFVADFIGQTNFFDGTVESGGEVIVVRTEGGHLLQCSSAVQVSPGDHVVVSVRPEAIGAASNAMPNRIEGTLARMTYLGDLVQYHVETAAGGEIVLQRQNDPYSKDRNWNIGQRVEVGFDERSALVLIDDQGQLAGEADRHLEDRTAVRG